MHTIAGLTAETQYQVCFKSKTKDELMAKYRKKPVIIEAVQITRKMTVETLEGVMTGNPGDYLITGVKGEQYFCKLDIFEMTYELVKQ